MGNAITYRENFRSATVNRMSNGLRNFIENECPVYLSALTRSNDFKLRDIVVKQFNESVPDRIFDNIYSILPYLECLRLKRVQNLNELTSSKFSNESKIKLSCLPCRINEYLTLCYFDTGSSISCITISNAKKLNLVPLIDHTITGYAVGFGCNRKIIGFLRNLPVQFGNDLLFNINFVVINQANADFILIGSDFMHKNSLKLDYLAGKLIFPKQIINEYELDFIPTKPEERDLFFDLFKYEMLEQSRALMQSYFSCPNDRTNESIAKKVNKIDNQLATNKSNWIDDKRTNRNTNLYIRMQINGKQVLALIDSGADTSKISENLAVKLDILRFIDYDKAKVSRGLGPILSIGRIPPIPITIYESDSNNNDENFTKKTPDTRRTVLFVAFEVIKESSSPNILLLGSDFFTFYGCCLDFDTKSIDIPLNPTSCRYSLEERDPKSMSFLNSDLDDNLSNENVINAFEASSELKKLQQKIQEKEHSYRLRKKLKRYKIELNKDEFDHLSNRRRTKFNKYDNLYLKALNTLNFTSIKQIVNNLSELDELDEQTSIFLDDEIKISDRIDHLQFKNQTSNTYLDTLTDQNSIIKVKFSNKLQL